MMSDTHDDPLTNAEIAGLPSDVKALAGWLAADGANWRASLPETSALDARVQALSLGLLEPIDSTEAPANLDDALHVPTPSVLAPARRRTGPMRAPIRLTRLSGLAGGAAMVAVVALIAGIFALQAASTPRGHSSARPTATPTPSADTVWADQSRLDMLAASVIGVGPVVAPSDPRVVYEAYTHYTDQSGKNVQLVLRRSDDAGATWHTLPIPGIGDVSQAPYIIQQVSFVVSPLDAHTVILQMYEHQNGSCPAIFVQHAAGFTTCQPQYRSTDGGATWAPLVTPDYRVPHRSLVGLTAPVSSMLDGETPVLRGQGARLYSAINCPAAIDYCVRFIASDDDGATWRTVDDALVARGVEIQDYAATPTGTTLFAVTSPGAYVWYAPTPLTLWRSDDAGATWRRISQLPTPYDDGLVTVASADPAQPLLYLDAPRITGYVTNKMGEHDPIRSYLADDLKVSTDGGRTWQSAPATGTPTRLRTYPGLLGTLADGSIVVGCVPDGGTDPYAPAGQDTNNNVTLYAWKLGDPTWRQLTPTLDHGLDTIVLTTEGSHQTLWVTNRTLAPLPVPTVVVQNHGTPTPYTPQGTLYHVLRFRLL